ncbi:hypothetical protein RND71_044071 [Anisodus tanguticus]|uniref:Acetyltransferase component of pyruvate dehydrogenase complex n=1 Tax=Anisodus tanguticus TaxID=243964 RepID=A0AAE1UTM7_9SOLA|nr:hypothetical protein RND71_044071 [Anisodus tanguticus]
MEMGTIISWEKKEGDQLSEGDLLAEIETDKATMGFETPEEGFLAKILIPAGEKNVPLGKVNDIAAFKDFVPSSQDTEQPSAKKEPAPTKTETQAQSANQSATKTTVSSPQLTQPKGGRIFASPLAKQIAAAKGINLSMLEGSGPNGRIIANDLDNIKTHVPEKISSSYQDLDLTSTRQTIAKRLSLSKQTIPHYYLNVEIEVDQLLKLRSQMNNMLSKENLKLSVNDFIIKAAALACKQVPEVNSSWQDTFIRQYNDVDISLAVNTDAGLITPIVFKANEIGVKEISQTVKNLANKAREGKLLPSEFQGGTFTISNLGMFGIDNFSAVINPPQSCILAVGSIEKRVVPNSESVNENDKLKVANILKVTLSCDHRTVDGAVGAKWLQHFTQYVNNPFTMVL